MKLASNFSPTMWWPPWRLPASLLLLAMLAAAAVSAQPCIECQDCKTNNCYSHCQKSCAVSSPSPSPGVAISDCEGFGRVAAASVASSACDTSLKYCEGPKAFAPTAAQHAAVSLTQCENIAYGVCQSTASDSSKSPCGYAFKGYKQCSGDQFMSFYKGEVDELCGKKVQEIAP